MPSTALQMVNRLLKNLGQTEVIAFSTGDRSALCLEHVNQAARSLFEEGSWDWLVRHDGTLRLHAALRTQAFVSLTAERAFDDGNNYSVIATTVAQTGFVKTSADVGAHVVITSDTKWAETTVKVDASFDTGPTRIVRLAHQWHADIGTGTFHVTYPELIFPLTVQTVTSARYQDEEVSLEMIDPEVGLDRRFVSPNQEDGPPRIIAIGGLSVETVADAGQFELATTTPTPRLRGWVWPIPDADYIVNYSYRLKPAALVAITDTFKDVPESAVDRIVDDATAEMMLTVPTSDVTLGELNRRSSLAKRERVASKHRPDKGRQFSMKSLDRVGSRRRRADRTFGSLTLDG